VGKGEGEEIRLRYCNIGIRLLLLGFVLVSHYRSYSVLYDNCPFVAVFLGRITKLMRLFQSLLALPFAVFPSLLLF
jgi:hypothetical protein